MASTSVGHAQLDNGHDYLAENDILFRMEVFSCCWGSLTVPESKALELLARAILLTPKQIAREGYFVLPADVVATCAKFRRARPTRR